MDIPTAVIISIGSIRDRRRAARRRGGHPTLGSLGERKLASGERRATAPL
jgi:hypothetical protein